MRTHTSSPRTARDGLVALLAALVTFAATSGCYNPTLNGTFKCNTEYDKGFDCPSGTTCVGGLCVKNGSTVKDAGVDKPVVDSGNKVDASVPETKVDATPPDVGQGTDTAQMCNMPVAGCTADTTKMCDPACQSGCTGCHQKCSVNTKGALTCNEPSAGRPRGLLEACNPASSGSAAQTDDCAPGLVCLVDGCSARCYQFCKADQDCTSAPCSKDVGGGQKVCDVPSSTCNPVKAGTNDGCGTATDTLACYISPTTADRTFCDCPFLANPENAACTISRDCIPGLACVSNVCRRVCSLANGNGDCQPGQTCTSLNGSTKYGSCGL